MLLLFSIMTLWASQHSFTKVVNEASTPPLVWSTELPVLVLKRVSRQLGPVTRAVGKYEACYKNTVKQN